jgi:hypothetical protein
VIEQFCNSVIGTRAGKVIAVVFNYPITRLQNLFLDPALVRARDAHVFAVFGYRAAGHLDSL